MGIPDKCRSPVSKRSRLCLRPKSSILDDSVRVKPDAAHLSSPKLKGDEDKIGQCSPIRDVIVVEDSVEPRVPPIATLFNMGNTCYLNSMLQVLRFTPGFVQCVTSLNEQIKSIESDQLLGDQEESCPQTGKSLGLSNKRAEWNMVKSLHQVFQTMSEKEKEYSISATNDATSMAVWPTDLLDSIRVLNQMFEGHCQHDAQELLRCLLCFLEDGEVALWALLDSSKDRSSTDVDNCGVSQQEIGVQPDIKAGTDMGDRRTFGCLLKTQRESGKFVKGLNENKIAMDGGKDGVSCRQDEAKSNEIRGLKNCTNIHADSAAIKFAHVSISSQNSKHSPSKIKTNGVLLIEKETLCRDLVMKSGFSTEDISSTTERRVPKSQQEAGSYKRKHSLSPDKTPGTETTAQCLEKSSQSISLHAGQRQVKKGKRMLRKKQTLPNVTRDKAANSLNKLNMEFNDGSYLTVGSSSELRKLQASKGETGNVDFTALHDGGDGCRIEPKPTHATKATSPQQRSILSMINAKPGGKRLGMTRRGPQSPKATEIANDASQKSETDSASSCIACYAERKPKAQSSYDFANQSQVLTNKDSILSRVTNQPCPTLNNESFEENSQEAKSSQSIRHHKKGLSDIHTPSPVAVRQSCPTSSQETCNQSSQKAEHSQCSGHPKKVPLNKDTLLTSKAQGSCPALGEETQRPICARPPSGSPLKVHLSEEITALALPAAGGSPRLTRRCANPLRAGNSSPAQLETTEQHQENFAFQRGSPKRLKLERELAGLLPGLESPSKSTSSLPETNNATLHSPFKSQSLTPVDFTAEILTPPSPSLPFPLSLHTSMGVPKARISCSAPSSPAYPQYKLSGLPSALHSPLTGVGCQSPASGRCLKLELKKCDWLGVSPSKSISARRALCVMRLKDGSYQCCKPSTPFVRSVRRKVNFDDKTDNSPDSKSQIQLLSTPFCEKSKGHVSQEKVSPSFQTPESFVDCKDLRISKDDPESDSKRKYPCKDLKNPDMIVQMKALGKSSASLPEASEEMKNCSESAELKKKYTDYTSLRKSILLKPLRVSLERCDLQMKNANCHVIGEQPKSTASPQGEPLQFNKTVSSYSVPCSDSNPSWSNHDKAANPLCLFENKLKKYESSYQEKATLQCKDSSQTGHSDGAISSQNSQDNRTITLQSNPGEALNCQDKAAKSTANGCKREIQASNKQGVAGLDIWDFWRKEELMKSPSQTETRLSVEGEGLSPSNARQPLIHRLFGGVMTHSTRCLECERSSQQHEAFMDVSVPVRTPQSEALSSDDEEGGQLTKRSDPYCLSQLVRTFASTERLGGPDKYCCDTCSHHTEADRSCYFSRLPGVMTLHLKRFSASKGLFGGTTKLNDRVTIPNELPCLLHGCRPDCVDPNHLFTLYALVTHSGVSLLNGHYRAYVCVRSPDHPALHASLTRWLSEQAGDSQNPVLSPSPSLMENSNPNTFPPLEAPGGTLHFQEPMFAHAANQHVNQENNARFKSSKENNFSLKCEKDKVKLASTTSGGLNMTLECMKGATQSLSVPSQRNVIIAETGEVCEEPLPPMNSVLSSNVCRGGPSYWLECDDECVRVMREEEFMDRLSETTGALMGSPYVLFYGKKSMARTLTQRIGGLSPF